MRRQVAQTRPANTSAATALSATAPWYVYLIIVCNADANDRTFSIYHDADGTTYDGTTALYSDVPIRANDTAYIEFPEGLSNSDIAGTLGIKSGEADKITFTVYGEIHGERI